MIGKAWAIQGITLVSLASSLLRLPVNARKCSSCIEMFSKICSAMPIQVPVEGPRTPLPHMGGSDVEVFRKACNLSDVMGIPGNLQIMGDLWLDVPCS